MARARNAFGTVRLILATAAIALNACAPELGPPQEGSYAWYEGPYFPWFSPEHFYWPGVSRFGGWHGGWHAHGVHGGGGGGGHHGMASGAEKA